MLKTELNQKIYISDACKENTPNHQSSWHTIWPLVWGAGAKDACTGIKSPTDQYDAPTHTR